MDDTELTQLDPSYTTVMRIEGLLATLPFVIGAAVLSIAEVVPAWVPGVPVLILAIILIGILPLKRYRTRGYDMSSDRLRVVKGVLFHSDTVVPFSRVQHLDVEQGPLERMFGIARLILHTAGTHNSSVTLPGLRHEIATTMREDIRQHVKRESM
ncbi:PH domain-containing protein [Aurantiacibacter sp. D1-12]|uniref:PH domain-containing protein n=1 Tax=Aurantiacibacter sp. D1-12 TaxID=2993658 RepID=UPI00237CC1B3|nr:PH domain-containing protein [Aurantiacibacter sp. D1-12]MDE1468050.1 PH domain-containing protein [Aurantiacibacter sp. D1-12]